MTSANERPGPVPSELRVAADKKSLTVTFSDDERYRLEAELLRVCSPSAEVQGHGPGQRVTVYGKRNVEIMKVEPVGNYAVRITFDDMHNTGIFSWFFLREIGREREERWEEYLADMQAKGLSRDPAGRRG
ncbi:gamma-butyrobetaine hydroxylase-like domain-containing protein [Pararhizobium haloflavum]|uniref:gamma-butyrobetaine hydroxylase-like domain-containing protein n=1 Tax=Pararhizobium haloflavum TaxID=2037914 RepID=UPI000C18C7C5|nr:DUF971 domain-containing protein [Pararhizobium haloflavum]